MGRYHCTHPMRDEYGPFCPRSPDTDPADEGKTWEEHCDSCVKLYERQMELEGDARREE